MSSEQGWSDCKATGKEVGVVQMAGLVALLVFHSCTCTGWCDSRFKDFGIDVGQGGGVLECLSLVESTLKRGRNVLHRHMLGGVLFSKQFKRDSLRSTLLLLIGSVTPSQNYGNVTRGSQSESLTHVDA